MTLRLTNKQSHSVAYFKNLKGFLSWKIDQQTLYLLEALAAKTNLLYFSSHEEMQAYPTSMCQQVIDNYYIFRWALDIWEINLKCVNAKCV